MADYYWNENLMRVITAYPDHKKRYLSNMNLSDQDMQIIVNEALSNQQCVELDLSSNRFTSEGARILATALEQNTVIELLDLNTNRIKDEGVEYLVAALRTCHSLIHLRLGTNAITDIGAEYLSRLLVENERIKLLELSSNELTSRGIIALAQAVPHTCLEYFYMDGNRQINDECIDVIIVMIREAKSLRGISLLDNDFSSKGKEKLRKVVKNKHVSFLAI